MKDESSDQVYTPDDREAILNLMEAFYKVWEVWDKEKLPSGPDAQTGKCDPYEQVKCPGSGGGGGVPEMCKAINAWAACWKAWGDKVHDKLWPGPNDPPRPPPPPFE